MKDQAQLTIGVMWSLEIDSDDIDQLLKTAFIVTLIHV